MKHKHLRFSLALMLVVGAALWGVNWRLDHPPLTKADKEFRALVAGADSVQATQTSCQLQPLSTCTNNRWIIYPPLNASQTRELTGVIRFSQYADPPVGTAWESRYVRLNLQFKRHGKELAYLAILQDDKTGLLVTCFEPELASLNGFAAPTYQINPRFNKRLNRALDAYLPQRVRP